MEVPVKVTLRFIKRADPNLPLVWIEDEGLWYYDEQEDELVNRFVAHNMVIEYDKHGFVIV